MPRSESSTASEVGVWPWRLLAGVLILSAAAARALGKFSHYQATEALVRVMQNEKDIALRDRAHESLQIATGKKLPPDAKEWEQLLHQASYKE